MSSFLYSLGQRAFAARGRVLAIWLLVLAVAGGAAGLLNKGLDNTVTIPGTESQEALDRLEHYQKHGATEYAFGWAEVIDKERWHTQRCA